jgi:hypothetical protein
MEEQVQNVLEDQSKVYVTQKPLRRDLDPQTSRAPELRGLAPKTISAWNQCTAPLNSKVAKDTKPPLPGAVSAWEAYLRAQKRLDVMNPDLGRGFVDGQQESKMPVPVRSLPIAMPGAAPPAGVAGILEGPAAWRMADQRRDSLGAKETERQRADPMLLVLLATIATVAFIHFIHK